MVWYFNSPDEYGHILERKKQTAFHTFNEKWEDAKLSIGFNIVLNKNLEDVVKHIFCTL